MGMKDKIVLVIGLAAIFTIAALIINGTNECFNDEAKASAAMNGVLLQQKDVLIAKLMSMVKAKQAQLDSAKAEFAVASAKFDASKAEFEGTKKKLDNIRAELNAPAETSAKSKR
jgi:hypothetical protein